MTKKEENLRKVSEGKTFPIISIPLDLEAALGDPRIAHVVLGATLSSQGHVENSVVFPWLELASGIVLWDTQRSKCSPRSLGLPTVMYVT